MEQNNKPLFIIDNAPVIEWPVIVSLPVAGGTFAEFQFEATMRVLSPDEYERLLKVTPSADAEKDIPIIERPMSEVLLRNVPIFQHLFTGWKGVKDRDGNAVAYKASTLAEQITGPHGMALSTGIWRAINEVRYGTRLNGIDTPSARLGN